MDSSIIQQLGQLRQQEILEAVERGRRVEALPAWWRERLGLALIAIGRKLASSERDMLPSNVTTVRGVHGDV
jgi:hypothetical protein